MEGIHGTASIHSRKTQILIYFYFSVYSIAQFYILGRKIEICPFATGLAGDCDVISGASRNRVYCYTGIGAKIGRASCRERVFRAV
jgi:hypothetical protein